MDSSHERQQQVLRLVQRYVGCTAKKVLKSLSVGLEDVAMVSGRFKQLWWTIRQYYDGK